MKIKIKPEEIKNFKYWFHLGILAFVVLGILQIIKGGQMLTLTNWLLSIPLLGLGDILAHTLLQLD